MTSLDPNERNDRDRLKVLRRRRSIALMVLLFALSALFYAVTLVKIGQQAQMRGLLPGADP